MSNLDGSPARVSVQLARFRRRLILVAFFRALPLSLAISLGFVMLFAKLMAVLVACGALAAAVLVAYRRTGGLVDVAATLDRRFGLANRLATALAFAAHGDEISSLIAEDAAIALSRRRPEDIAFETPRHLAWIVGGAAALVLAAVVARPSPSESDVSVASQGVLGADAAVSPSGGRRAPASAPSSSAVVSEAARRAAAAADDRRATAQSASSKPTSLDQAGNRRPSAAESPAQIAAAAGEPTRNPATARASAEPNGASAGGRGGRGQSAGEIASLNHAPSARGDLGGGVGVNARRSTTARAGGVRGTGGEPSTAQDGERAAAATRSSVAPVAAWGRAESAIEREHLPLERRTYVHDYLVAIKSGGLR